MSESPLEGRCGANKGGGRGYCEKYGYAGGQRCRRHSGQALMGAANPAFTTGRYSKYLPPRLQERYGSAMQDPSLLSVRDDIALMDARLEDLLRRADTGEAGKVWEQLKQQRTELLSARGRKDMEGVQMALSAILGLIQHGHQDHMTWEDIRSTVLDRNRLVRSEQKRLVDMHQMVTVERLVTFVQTLANVLLSEIPDKAVARRVVSKVQGMLTLDGQYTVRS